MSGDREAARHITRTWFEWEIDGLARKVILVVETDLAMQPDEQDYDALTLDMLRTEAIARSRASPGAIDRIRIDRKGVVTGKRGSVSGDAGGCRTIKKKKKQRK